MLRAYLLILILNVIFLQNQQIRAAELFPHPKELRPRIQFWEKIFSVYSKTTYVIHDTKNPELIIDIIDFKKIKNKYPTRQDRFLFAEKYRKRYQHGVSLFNKMGLEAKDYSDIENRLYDVYKNDSRKLGELLAGEVDIRLQSGMSDELMSAFNRAKNDLPFMEKLFIQKGLPRELTRIVFIESMFNHQALSHKGAAGVWQIMPYIAKKHLAMNTLVDERLSPYKATKLAAQLLFENHALLKNWPLAITAYNHGAQGILTAIRQTGSYDIGKIVTEYKGPSFGFASKNFYAEFLAVMNIIEKKLPPPYEKPLASYIKSYRLTKKLSPYELIEHVFLSKSNLLKYNKDFKQQAFGRFKHIKLPLYFEIFIPEFLEKKFSTLAKHHKEKGQRL